MCVCVAFMFNLFTIIKETKAIFAYFSQKVQYCDVERTNMELGIGEVNFLGKLSKFYAVFYSTLLTHIFIIATQYICVISLNLYFMFYKHIICSYLYVFHVLHFKHYDFINSTRFKMLSICRMTFGKVSNSKILKHLINCL